RRQQRAPPLCAQPGRAQPQRERLPTHHSSTVIRVAYGSRLSIRCSFGTIYSISIEDDPSLSSPRPCSVSGHPALDRLPLSFPQGGAPVEYCAFADSHAAAVGGRD